MGQKLRKIQKESKFAPKFGKSQYNFLLNNSEVLSVRIQKAQLSPYDDTLKLTDSGFGFRQPPRKMKK